MPYLAFFCDMNYGAGLKITKAARCLQARYHKGISNFRETTGVVVMARMNASQDGKVFDSDGISQCLSAGHHNTPKVAIPVSTPDRGTKNQNGRRMKNNGEPMFALTTQDVHGVAVDVAGIMSIKIKEATKKGYAAATEGDAINLAVPGSKTRRGRVGKGVANTLDTSCQQAVVIHIGEDCAVYAIWNEEHQCYIAIRRLTPKECFRLQGWEDEYFNRAALASSETQLYRQAGNGVTVPVIQAIGERMNPMGQMKYRRNGKWDFLK